MAPDISNSNRVVHGLDRFVARRALEIRQANRGLFASMWLRFVVGGEEARAKAADIAAAVRAELDRLGLPQIAVRVVDRLFVTLQDGTRARANAMYEDGVITVALDSGEALIANIRHETVHALRDLGLFRAAEWRVLERRRAPTRTPWRGPARPIPTSSRGCPGRGRGADPRGVIAQQFGDWSAGRMEARGILRTAFERIRAFLEAVRNALRGNGFTSSDQVFRRIEGARSAGACQACRAAAVERRGAHPRARLLGCAQLLSTGPALTLTSRP